MYIWRLFQYISQLDTHTHTNWLLFWPMSYHYSVCPISILYGKIKEKEEKNNTFSYAFVTYLSVNLNVEVENNCCVCIIRTIFYIPHIHIIVFSIVIFVFVYHKQMNMRIEITTLKHTVGDWRFNQVHIVCVSKIRTRILAFIHATICPRSTPSHRLAFSTAGPISPFDPTQLDPLPTN